MSEYDCHKCSTHHTTENMVCYCASCFATSESARVKAEQERESLENRCTECDRGTHYFHDEPVTTSMVARMEERALKAEQERDEFKARACVPDRECKAIAVLNDEIKSLRAELKQVEAQERGHREEFESLRAELASERVRRMRAESIVTELRDWQSKVKATWSEDEKRRNELRARAESVITGFTGMRTDED